MKANCRLTAVMLALAMLALASSAASALTDEQRCLSGRAKAKGKYEECVERRLAKAYGGGALDAQLEQRAAKCRIKYAGAWTKLQDLTGSTTCGGVPRYTDNGDGTVSDNLTGLVWEKKTTAVGSGTDFSGDRHDVDNDYSWSTGLPYAESGTAYTDFLANLNAGGGFAGANAWRLPTFAELQTILLPEEYPCLAIPCIDPIFGPTQSFFYCSATGYAPAPDSAWVVYFTAGYVSAGSKTYSFYVRAVRGG